MTYIDVTHLKLIDAIIKGEVVSRLLFLSPCLISLFALTIKPKPCCGGKLPK